MEPNQTNHFVKLQICLKDIRALMTRNVIQLNLDKTDVLTLCPQTPDKLIL